MANAILRTVIGALVASTAVIGSAAQSATAQGFTGSFAPEQWELFNSSPAFPNIDNSQITINNIPLAPFNGSVDFTNAPDSLTLVGSNQSAILSSWDLAVIPQICRFPYYFCAIPALPPCLSPCPRPVFCRLTGTTPQPML